MSTSLRDRIRHRRNRERVYTKAAFWDMKADRCEGTAVSGWANEQLNALHHEQEVKLVHRWLPSVDGARVLDVGCGTGRIARHLAERGASVVGVDFSPRAIDIARRESPCGNPRYRVQSVFELAEANEFDIALSMGCLVVACSDRVGLLRALARIRGTLKPGGRLLLLEPVHRGPLHFVLNMGLREFRASICSAGFAVEEITALHFWPIARVLGQFDCPRSLTVAGCWLEESVLALANARGRLLFGDYKALLTSRR